MTPKEVGPAICAITRAARGKSYKGLSEHVGVSRRQVGHWSSGRRKISARYIDLLAEYIDVESWVIRTILDVQSSRGSVKIAVNKLKERLSREAEQGMKP